MTGIFPAATPKPSTPTPVTVAKSASPSSSASSPGQSTASNTGTTTFKTAIGATGTAQASTPSSNTITGSAAGLVVGNQVTATSTALPGSSYTVVIPGSAPGSIAGYQQMGITSTGASVAQGSVQSTPNAAVQAASTGAPSTPQPNAVTLKLPSGNTLTGDAALNYAKNNGLSPADVAANPGIVEDLSNLENQKEGNPTYQLAIPAGPANAPIENVGLTFTPSGLTAQPKYQGYKNVYVEKGANIPGTDQWTSEAGYYTIGPSTTINAPSTGVQQISLDKILSLPSTGLAFSPTGQPKPTPYPNVPVVVSYDANGAGTITGFGTPDKVSSTYSIDYQGAPYTLSLTPDGKINASLENNTISTLTPSMAIQLAEEAAQAGQLEAETGVPAPSMGGTPVSSIAVPTQVGGYNPVTHQYGTGYSNPSTGGINYAYSTATGPSLPEGTLYNPLPEYIKYAQSLPSALAVPSASSLVTSLQTGTASANRALDQTKATQIGMSQGVPTNDLLLQQQPNSQVATILKQIQPTSNAIASNTSSNPSSVPFYGYNYLNSIYNQIIKGFQNVGSTYINESQQALSRQLDLYAALRSGQITQREYDTYTNLNAFTPGGKALTQAISQTPVLGNLVDFITSEPQVQYGLTHSNLAGGAGLLSALPQALAAGYLVGRVPSATATGYGLGFVGQPALTDIINYATGQPMLTPEQAAAASLQGGSSWATYAGLLGGAGSMLQGVPYIGDIGKAINGLPWWLKYPVRSAEGATTNLALQNALALYQTGTPATPQQDIIAGTLGASLPLMGDIVEKYVPKLSPLEITKASYQENPYSEGTSSYKLTAKVPQLVQDMANLFLNRDISNPDLETLYNELQTSNGGVKPTTQQVAEALLSNPDMLKVSDLPANPARYQKTLLSLTLGPRLMAGADTFDGTLDSLSSLNRVIADAVNKNGGAVGGSSSLAAQLPTGASRTPGDVDAEFGDKAATLKAKADAVATTVKTYYSETGADPQRIGVQEGKGIGPGTQYHITDTNPQTGTVTKLADINYQVIPTWQIVELDGIKFIDYKNILKDKLSIVENGARPEVVEKAKTDIELIKKAQQDYGIGVPKKTSPLGVAVELGEPSVPSSYYVPERNIADIVTNRPLPDSIFKNPSDVATYQKALDRESAVKAAENPSNANANLEANRFRTYTDLFYTIKNANLAPIKGLNIDIEGHPVESQAVQEVLTDPGFQGKIRIEGSNVGTIAFRDWRGSGDVDTVSLGRNSPSVAKEATQAISDRVNELLGSDNYGVVPEKDGSFTVQGKDSEGKNFKITSMHPEGRTIPSEEDKSYNEEFRKPLGLAETGKDLKAEGVNVLQPSELIGRKVATAVAPRLFTEEGLPKNISPTLQPFVDYLRANVGEGGAFTGSLGRMTDTGDKMFPNKDIGDTLTLLKSMSDRYFGGALNDEIMKAAQYDLTRGTITQEGYDFLNTAPLQDIEARDGVTADALNAFNKAVQENVGNQQATNVGINPLLKGTAQEAAVAEPIATATPSTALVTMAPSVPTATQPSSVVTATAQPVVTAGTSSTPSYSYSNPYDPLTQAQLLQIYNAASNPSTPQLNTLINTALQNNKLNELYQNYMNKYSGSSTSTMSTDQYNALLSSMGIPIAASGLGGIGKMASGIGGSLTSAPSFSSASLYSAAAPTSMIDSSMPSYQLPSYLQGSFNPSSMPYSVLQSLYNSGYLSPSEFNAYSSPYIGVNYSSPYASEYPSPYDYGSMYNSPYAYGSPYDYPYSYGSPYSYPYSYPYNYPYSNKYPVSPFGGAPYYTKGMKQPQEGLTYARRYLPSLIAEIFSSHNPQFLKGFQRLEETSPGIGEGLAVRPLLPEMVAQRAKVRP